METGRNSLVLMDGLNYSEKQLCIELFAAIDEDGDGFVDQKDIEKWTRSENPKTDTRKASRIMAALDRNNDGSCDRGEWLHFCLNLKWIGHLDKFINDLKNMREGVRGAELVSPKANLRSQRRHTIGMGGGGMKIDPDLDEKLKRAARGKV